MFLCISVRDNTHAQILDFLSHSEWYSKVSINAADGSCMFSHYLNLHSSNSQKSKLRTKGIIYNKYCKIKSVNNTHFFYCLCFRGLKSEKCGYCLDIHVIYLGIHVIYLYIQVNSVITLPRRNEDGSPIPCTPRG